MCEGLLCWTSMISRSGGLKDLGRNRRCLANQSHQNTHMYQSSHFLCCADQPSTFPTGWEARFTWVLCRVCVVYWCHVESHGTGRGSAFLSPGRVPELRGSEPSSGLRSGGDELVRRDAVSFVLRIPNGVTIVMGYI